MYFSGFVCCYSVSHCLNTPTIQWANVQNQHKSNTFFLSVYIGWPEWVGVIFSKCLDEIFLELQSNKYLRTPNDILAALKSNSWLTWHRSACTEVSWFVFICILSMPCLIILIPRKGCKVQETLMSALSCKGNNSKMIKRHLPVFFLQGRLSTGGTDQQLYAGIKHISTD